ncbi:MAG: CRISPR-associated helicase Cas3' [Syntrophaceae bacterium]|nr:CRISPR-associated helicase Cas3' [Syntrophaceae bacterium]
MTSNITLQVRDLIAHVKSYAKEKVTSPHKLEKHLINTAQICGQFTQVFGLEKIGKILGLTHDIGKASKEFQNRIKAIGGIEAHLERKTPQHVDHSTAAAKYLIDKYGKSPGLILAYIVAGHHTGLPDGKGESDSVLVKRLKKDVKDYSTIVQWLEEKLPDKLDPQDFIPSNFNPAYRYQMHLLIRMLYSALTDADFLDTESYMDPEKAISRNSRYPSINEIRDHFLKYLEKLKSKEQTEINQKRNQILEWCINSAEKEKGIFSLTVPTGGGKTLSSMAFALNHAVKHILRRIIYVIPYTSIIEQNAQVFKDILQNLSENIVLEHHSNFEPTYENPFNRLAPENWNAPIIVTTNVRFFESFYANKSSACRRLHNVSNSVIIFDEAQMIPREYLQPCLLTINELTRHYGCSAVICTATQPAIQKSDYLKKGLEGVREIVPRPTELYENFRRVQIKQLKKNTTSSEMGNLLGKHDQVLCIVNTRKEARLIFEKLRENSNNDSCFHLSTLMCPEHRIRKLEEIRDRLKKQLPCRLVSTQLIEAGVDIDFPVVYRAIAGLDSIAQSAGRCNREGRLNSGVVYVFQGETLPPPGHLRQSADSGRFALKIHPDDPLTPAAIKTYFLDYYGKEGRNFDNNDIIRMCEKPPDAIPFREIAKKFNLIEEVQFPIIIPYGEKGKNIREELKSCYNGFVPTELRRKLHRLTVKLHERPFRKLRPAMEDIFGDGRYFVLINQDIYDIQTGLKPDIPEFQQIESLIL